MVLEQLLPRDGFYCDTVELMEVLQRQMDLVDAMIFRECWDRSQTASLYTTKAELLADFHTGKTRLWIYRTQVAKRITMDIFDLRHGDLLFLAKQDEKEQIKRLSMVETRVTEVIHTPLKEISNNIPSEKEEEEIEEEEEDDDEYSGDGKQFLKRRGPYNKYTMEDKVATMKLMKQGIKFKTISREQHIPINTLKRWK